jgi:hypothetical protein
MAKKLANKKSAVVLKDAALARKVAFTETLLMSTAYQLGTVEMLSF